MEDVASAEEFSAPARASHRRPRPAPGESGPASHGRIATGPPAAAVLLKASVDGELPRPNASAHIPRARGFGSCRLVAPSLWELQKRGHSRLAKNGSAERPTTRSSTQLPAGRRQGESGTFGPPHHAMGTVIPRKNEIGRAVGRSATT